MCKSLSDQYAECTQTYILEEGGDGWSSCSLHVTFCTHCNSNITYKLSYIFHQQNKIHGRDSRYYTVKLISFQLCHELNSIFLDTKSE